MIVTGEMVIEHMKKSGNVSLADSITSTNLAKDMAVEPKHVSWALSSAFKNGKPTLLRREKAAVGRGWVYWVSTRSAKAKPLRERKPKSSKTKTQKLAPGIGIYFCRDEAEDIMLTFKEAKAMYDQLTVVFG